MLYLLPAAALLLAYLLARGTAAVVAHVDAWLLLALLALGGSGCSEAHGARGLFGPRRFVNPGTPYQIAVAASNPSYWWWANDATGNLLDHADSNPAVPTGSVGYHETTLMVGETFSIKQAGPGIYLTLTGDVVLSGNFTLEWWYKRPAATGFNPFWSQAAGFAPEVYFFSGLMQVIDTNGSVCASSSTMDDTNTHYVVVTRSGTTCTIYDNGADATTTHNAWSGSLTFTIHQILHETGSGNGSTWWQHGAVYPGTVLSGAAISAHYAAGI